MIHYHVFIKILLTAEKHENDPMRNGLKRNSLFFNTKGP